VAEDYSDSNPPIYLPGSAAETLLLRAERLTGRIAKSQTDFFAIFHNEFRASKRLAVFHGLEGTEIDAVMIWHSRNVESKVEYRGRVQRVEEATPGSFLRRHSRSCVALRLRPVLRNPILNALPSWISNRKVEARAMYLRLMQRP
jgi:hypothetical protein